MYRLCRFNLLILLYFCLITAFGQQQSERIIHFHSDIVIDTSGKIEVTEQIKIYAAGIDVKRGIVREIPLFRKDNKGRRVRMNTDVLAVKCNGNDVKYRTEHENNKLAIYVGDEKVLLNTGEYTYTIVYESYGQIGFFDDYDELYWNVQAATGLSPLKWRRQQSPCPITPQQVIQPAIPASKALPEKNAR